MPTLHSITERRRPLRRGRHRVSDGAPRTRRAEQTGVAPTPSLAGRPESLGEDLAARRVRAEGGPLDQASYNCQCGFVFAAAVTTSVVCPHCGDPQAW